MLVGHPRVSEADGSQSLHLQTDALTTAGVEAGSIYEDRASDKVDARPGVDACLKALRGGDTLVVWKLDRLGRNLRHLVNTVHDLTEAGIGLKVLTGQGAAIDTTTPAGQLVFAALAERDTSASDLCAELGTSRQTLHRYISPTGALRPNAQVLLGKTKTGR